MSLSCPYGVDYGGVVLVLMPDVLEFPQEGVVPKEMWHAYHDSHGECFAVFQVKSFIGSEGVFGVQPNRPSAEDVGEMVVNLEQ